MPPCPYCSGRLIRYGHHLRDLKNSSGSRIRFFLQNTECKRCGSHSLLFPDFIIPYKQFEGQLISDVIDDVITKDDMTADKAPEDRTLQRWKKWYAGNRAQIEGIMRSIGSRLDGFGEDLLNSADSLLEQIRIQDPEWMATIVRLIYNTGNSLLTEKEVCLHQYDLTNVPAETDLSSSHKEEKGHEFKGIEPMAGPGSGKTAENDRSAAGRYAGSG